MEGHWKFRGGGGSQKRKFLKESKWLNWNFQRGGGGIQTKKPSEGGVWTFSGTTHSFPKLHSHGTNHHTKKWFSVL